MRSLRLWFCAWVILALVGIEVSPAAADYYTPGSPVKVATGSTAAGYTHTEGPLYDNAGGVLYCELNSTHTNDRIYRYNMSTGANDLLDSNSGGTQGMFFNPSGQIVAADRDHRHVAIRSSADITQETVLVSSYNGKTFNGPNDLAIDSAGGIYFTDPDYENRASLPDAAYYLAPNGTLSQIITIFRPNGIALSPDQHTLYLALQQNAQILAFDLLTPGVLSNQRVFANTGLVNNLGPDGITVDRFGNLIASTRGMISAWNPAGTKLWDLTMPEQPANIELAGPNSESLFITAGRSLYRAPLTLVPEPTCLAPLLLCFAALRRR